MASKFKQEEEMRWPGRYISSLRIQLLFPVIHLSCHLRAPSVPLPLTLSSVSLWNLQCSPQAWLLPVMVLCNSVSCVYWIGYIAVDIDSFWSLTNIAYHVPSSLPMSSASSSVFLSLITLHCELSSSCPGRKLFYSDSNSFRETFGGVL